MGIEDLRPDQEGYVVLSSGGTLVRNDGVSIVQAVTGTATGYTAGATTGTFHTDDSYTGNVGTTKYTVNGVVAALKNLGLIAS